MNRLYLFAALLTVVVFGAVGASPLAAQPPVHYRVTAIVPTTPSEDNLPEALNAGGVGVGRMFSGAADGDRALLFSNGATQKLGTLPTSGVQVYSYGYGINDLGHIVGESTVGNSNSNPHAFLYSNNTMQDLGTIGGTFSASRSINNADQVVGRSSDGNGGFVPFLWEVDHFINLGTLGGTSGTGEDINSLGHVAGSSMTGGQNRAFFWSDRNGNRQSDSGEMVSLGVLSGYDQSVASALNNSDVVVGRIIAGSSNDYRAFTWSDSNGNNVTDPGEMTLLPLLSTAVASNAFDINEFGPTVGETRFADSTTLATLWSGTQVLNLNTLLDLTPGQTIPTLVSALSINNAGQILATGEGLYRAW